MSIQKETFTPISGADDYLEALAYIAERAAELAETVLKQSLPLDTLTVFTHSIKEYEIVKSLVLEKGVESKFSHGGTTYVDADVEVAGRNIRLLGVREPDVNRPERGYGDYPVSNFPSLKKQFQGDHFVKFMTSESGIPMLELRHPGFDVRGYVVPDGREAEALSA